MRAVFATAALAAVTVLAGACGSSGSSTDSGQAAQPRPAAPQYDRAQVTRALLQRADLPSSATVRDKQPIDVGLDVQSMKYLTQEQPLEGAKFEPVVCASMLNSGFPDVSKLQGMTRVFANQPFAHGMVASAVVPGPSPADLNRVLRTVADCSNATVTLTKFGITGKLRQQIVQAPTVDADAAIAFKQTVTWPRDLPAQAKGFAKLFDADAVYMVKGHVTVWVSTDGEAGVSAAELAPKALARAAAEFH